MKENFNETMRWLHTYSGLIVGWLLFAIFVTGTSAYYKNEITLWMQPEFHKSKQSDKTLDIAINKAIEKIERNDKVSVTLPNSRSNLIAVRVENSNKKNKLTKEKEEFLLLIMMQVVVKKLKRLLKQQVVTFYIDSTLNFMKFQEV